MFDKTKLIFAAAFLSGTMLVGPAFAQSASLYGGGPGNVGVGAGGGGGTGMDPAGGGPGVSGGTPWGGAPFFSAEATGPAVVPVGLPTSTNKRKK